MSKRMRAYVVHPHTVLSHAPANDHPDKPSPDWSKRSDERYEQMPTCTARARTLKVSDDRFANLILQRELLGSASLRSSDGDRFASPINVVELQVRNLGGPKAVDGT
jgi:hypothetical protein